MDWVGGEEGARHEAGQEQATQETTLDTDVPAGNSEVGEGDEGWDEEA